MLPLASRLLIALSATLPLFAQQPPQPDEKAPNVAIVPAPRTDQGILARQAETVRRAKETDKAPVVFVGDSITQGWEGAGKEVWRRHFAELGALNLGVSGDRTEHVLWRLQQAPITHLDPKVVVLLIGTNNIGHQSSDAEQTLEGVRAVLDLLRTQAPGARILFVEIFPRGERMNAMRGDILQINQAVRSHVDDNTRCLPVGDRWVRADGTIGKDMMPDFLHLTAAAYEQWAEALMPEIAAALR
ncbi:MAG TPA: GDSL-type esterase/lipase family protein [Planctomycetota bacterium]|nr:GDSL-type esterase/lipase family protein [Planctomycetota bacterium]